MNFGFLHISEPLDYPAGLYVSHGVRIIEVLLYKLKDELKKCRHAMTMTATDSVKRLKLVECHYQIKYRHKKGPRLCFHPLGLSDFILNGIPFDRL